MGSGEEWLERGRLQLRTLCSPHFACNLCVALGMAQQDYHSHNKTHIVRLSIWIWYFYLLWSNQAEFNSTAASDIKVFTMGRGVIPG